MNRNALALTTLLLILILSVNVNGFNAATTTTTTTTQNSNGTGVTTNTTRSTVGVTYGTKANFTNHFTSYIRIWIKKMDNKMHFCGGTIVQPNRVVTAAHCYLNAKSLYLCSGSGDCLKPVGRCMMVDPLTTCYIHKGYAEALKHDQMWDDIAVLVLKQPITASRSKIIPIYRAPSFEPTYYDNMPCQLIGCGQTETGKAKNAHAKTLLPISFSLHFRQTLTKSLVCRPGGVTIPIQFGVLQSLTQKHSSVQNHFHN